jgi:fructose-1-phosphate kinase PfkB-like protein
VQVVAAARELIQSGVSSVLVTLSERGAVLVDKHGNITTQQALPVPGGAVVDGTAAGEYDFADIV